MIAVAPARPEVPAEEDDLEQEDRDRTRLAQLLDNLVSNAVKFTPERGRVGVRLTRREACVVVGVCDTGMGISPEEQEKLFQRFFRTSEATRRACPPRRRPAG